MQSGLVEIWEHFGNVLLCNYSAVQKGLVPLSIVRSVLMFLNKNKYLFTSSVPVLDPIQKSPETLFFGEEMTLSCRIHSFHPEALGVSWYKGDELLESQNDPILYDVNELFYLTSHVTYRPNEEDLGTIFRCEVSHQSLEHPKSVSWELEMQSKYTNIAKNVRGPVRGLSAKLANIRELCEPHRLQWEGEL
uniref:Ig-like domain-containing protein n=1 Tax=Xenopus tropicalis TaxID=8364 RepID=A0A6I8RQW2_XENTR